LYNLGNGKGFSVKEIIKVSEEVTGKKIKIVPVERRAGDPATLIAGSGRIKKELNWQPKYEDINTVISTAWEWHKNHPGGYADKK
jgi:UDP-glucose 4-epimerase